MNINYSEGINKSTGNKPYNLEKFGLNDLKIIKTSFPSGIEVIKAYYYVLLFKLVAIK